MTLTLTPETQKLLDAQLRSGSYPSADALVRAALEHLQADSSADLDDATVAALELGLSQARAGQGIPWKDARANLASQFGIK